MAARYFAVLFSGMIIPGFTWISTVRFPETFEKYSPSASLTAKEELGKLLFFDTSLSNPKGQSCASCHAPGSGFSDPSGSAVSMGAANSPGLRNAPGITYAAFSPDFHYDEVEEMYIGGQFWDGRAKDLCEQAKQPLLNHLEMNNSTKEMVVAAAKTGKLRTKIEKLYGKSVFADTDKAFHYIAEAIEAYEKSTEINAFTSKFDAYTKGKVKLSKTEMKGMKLFNDPKKGNCAACHSSTATASTPAVFTDFSYDNLGLPTNKLLAFQNGKPDLGLGAIVKKSGENGKFKVPSLRNVALTAPYFHNGVITTLEEAVEFYNTRDSGKFGPCEVTENVNREELGSLKLSKSEVSAIAAFLRTLTDGYQAP